MTTLLCLLYASICIVAFRFLHVSATKWTITTAAVGGIFLVGAIIIVMNYNHPFSTDGRIYFYATPISPAVNGQVVEVPVQANTSVKKGDILFRLDPRPFEYAVARRKAALAAAEQAVAEQKAALRSAEASVQSARANRDQAKDDYERHQAANSKNVKPFSDEEVADLRNTFRAAEAALTSAEAQADQARLTANSLIDGVDTNVAQLQAELSRAEFELEQSVYRAPTDGYATQVFLHPGMMAVSLPLKPVMTFVHTDRRILAAAFNQIGLQRVREGDEAEVSFAGVPGQVFRGKVSKVLPFMAEGQLEPAGTLQSATPGAGEGRVYVIVDITDDLSDFQLPGGVAAEVAIYTPHWTEFALIRKILLRMRAWENYLVFDR
ncbi:HlyD family secretion protein [Ochrobactrum sp. Q0168]|uniref:HlyD family secretion protein n=1 Tax=Ochrobactrum sp. Q0168 TaxID=2793241 RepID=UPI0018EBA93D|nr:HlyD family secretion protein [Ochrobactrum sp. Q0168]